MWRGGGVQFFETTPRAIYLRNGFIFTLKSHVFMSGLVYLDGGARATRLLYGPRIRMQHSTNEHTRQVPQIENLSGDGGAWRPT